MQVNYTTNQTFAQIHQSKDKYIFCRGPVGSGKSSGCIWHLVLSAMKQPVQHDGVRRSRYAIIRATYPALKSTVVKSWENWFKGIVKIVYDVPIRGTMTFPAPDGTKVEMEMVFIALDREDNVNKLQSLELTGAHINEAAEIPRGVHQMLKSRVNRYPDMRQTGGAVDPFIIADYNSVPTDHWLYKIAEEEQPRNHAFYHQPPALLLDPTGKSEIVDTSGNHYVINPEADNIENLADDYYVDQVDGAEADWVNVMILNNYGELRTGRPVYPEYIDVVHFNEKLVQPIQGIPIVLGVDLGLTPAAAFTQLTPMGKMQIFDEITTEDCSIQKFLEDYLKPHIYNNYPRYNFELVIDPTAIMTRSQNDARAAYEIVRKAGLPFRPAASNNWMKRREAVVYFLRKLNGLEIGPNCLMLRKGFISEYKFEKKRVSVVNVRASDADLFKEKPEKNIYSHVHDGLQYAALEFSEGRTARNKTRVIVSSDRTRLQDEPADSTAGY